MFSDQPSPTPYPTTDTQPLRSDTGTGTGTGTKRYPLPEAGYDEIVHNRDVFFQMFQGFHESFGTKFKVPTLGGNTLDVHRLFVEVTSRGGIEKVIRDRKWKEVSFAFNFPSTITSASFVLRKYYLSLLYHFEQVYYFRKEVPSISVTDPVNSTVDGSMVVHSGEDAANEFPVSSELEPGSLVSGTIDAKFDYGYLITINLGSEKLKGVLYHTPTGLEASQNSSTTTNHQSSAANAGHVHGNRKKERDPFRPKPNRSGYTFFFAEQYARLRPSYHGQEKGISKRIGHLWSKLSEDEKQVYQEKGLRDKERYRNEMLEYKSSIH